MTRDKDFKDQVRATAARTGESYVKVRAELRGEGMPRSPRTPRTGGTAPRVVAGDLTLEDVAAFHDRGAVLHLPGAFPREAALRIQDLLWDDVEERLGVDRADPSTWTGTDVPGRVWARTSGVIDSVEAVRNANLARLDQLLGQLLADRQWKHPRAWGNGVLVTPPHGPHRKWTLSDVEWHIDGPPVRGVWYFVLLCDIRPRGGGTLAIEGSGRAMARWVEGLDVDDRARLLSRFIDAEPFLGRLNGQDTAVDDPAALLGVHPTDGGDHLRVVELAGKAGDVFVLDSNILHAAPRRTDTTVRFQAREFLTFPDAPKWRGVSAVRRERKLARQAAPESD